LNSTSTDACGIASEVLSQTSFGCSDVGTFDITLTVKDVNDNETVETISVTVVDDTAPNITCVEDQTRANDPETCTYTVIGTEFDPTFDDNCSGAMVSNDYNNLDSLSGAIFEEGDTTVKWMVTDASGNKTTCSFRVTVSNEVPVTNNISGPIDPVQVNTGGVELTATYTDNNVTSATWKLITNDGVVDQYTCEECVDNGIITGSFNPQPGVYTIELTVTDACGAVDTFVYEYIVIFDPSGGFVTGGGWIDSPVGAMQGNYASVTGKANFGFNAKYKNGKNNFTEVDGHTNFQFKAGDLHFSSFEHEDMSLVISGKKATYTGYGTVNGTGSHKFRVIAIDGDANGGNDPDEFRIKIWGSNSNNEVLYDNMRGEAESSDLATVLGGGSIVIHKPKGAGKTKTMEDSTLTTKEKIEVEAEPMEILNNLEIAPNPVTAYANIRFSLKERLKADLRIYDLNGKLIKSLYSGIVNADQVVEVGFERENLMSGIYICKLLTGDGRSYEKQIVIN
ncbi:T9SS type A sorting domain-containing protein, partial [Christiangramia sediminis]